MSNLAIGTSLGLIFGTMIGIIVTLKYTDKLIGEYLTDMSTAFRAID